MSAPLIAISAKRQVQDSAFGPCDTTVQVLVYADAVLSAGGRPALLPSTEAVPADLLDSFDGLVLTGGGDLSPQMYGQDPDETVYGVSPIRDRFEAALVAEAQERGLPILAICRGMQLINVLRGGELQQHVEGHWQTAASDQAHHEVQVDEDSMLAKIVGGRHLQVNSYHHQAIGSLGAGLRVTGYAGHVIEAMEDPDHNLVAVQWHPEHRFEASMEDHALFDDLVTRARTYKEWRSTHV